MPNQVQPLLICILLQFNVHVPLLHLSCYILPLCFSSLFSRSAMWGGVKGGTAELGGGEGQLGLLRGPCWDHQYFWKDYRTTSLPHTPISQDGAANCNCRLLRSKEKIWDFFLFFPSFPQRATQLIADLSVWYKKGSFAWLEPLLLVELSGGVTLARLRFGWVCFALWKEGRQPWGLVAVGTRAGKRGLDTAFGLMWSPLGLHLQRAELSVLSRPLRWKML